MSFKQKIREVLTNRSTPTTYHNPRKMAPTPTRIIVAKKPTNAMLDRKYGKPSNGIGVGP